MLLSQLLLAEGIYSKISLRRNVVPLLGYISKQKAHSFPDESLPEWCHTQDGINLYMLYRQERETPKKRGIELLKDNRMCKGMAFTLYERQYFGIHGLLPPAFMTEDQQAYRVITNLRQQPDDLARYIQLDNLQTLLEDPFYIGLRRKRVRGEEYNHFIDNFMKACTKRERGGEWKSDRTLLWFGQNLLIQFEDFARHNAYHLLAKYRNQYCVFNDDIQGTAAVALAGLLACRRYTGRPLSTEKIIFFGAGSAAMGIANLCITQMEKEGINRKDAHSRIYLMDIDGLITQNRLHMEKEHIPYAKVMPKTKNLLELIKNIKPTILMVLQQ
ncbi:NAD-dependent malic enzyme [Dirofilaria immitis]